MRKRSSSCRSSLSAPSLLSWPDLNSTPIEKAIIDICCIVMMNLDLWFWFYFFFVSHPSCWNRSSRPRSRTSSPLVWSPSARTMFYSEPLTPHYTLHCSFPSSSSSALLFFIVKRSNDMLLSHGTSIGTSASTCPSQTQIAYLLLPYATPPPPPMLNVCVDVFVVVQGVYCRGQSQRAARLPDAARGRTLCSRVVLDSSKRNEGCL